MVKLTILSHPCTPVPEADLERWFELQVDRLRRAAPEGIVRCSRLVQGLPSTEIGIGWLLELELPGEATPREHDELADAVADLTTDMRVLGLQPTVLYPREPSHPREPFVPAGPLSDAPDAGEGAPEPAGMGEKPHRNRLRPKRSSSHDKHRPGRGSSLHPAF